MKRASTQFTQILSSCYSKTDGRSLQQVYSGESLVLRFNDPRTDSRMPDIIVQPQPGVIYTDAGFIAEHGGFPKMTRR